MKLMNFIIALLLFSMVITLAGMMVTDMREQYRNSTINTSTEIITTYDVMANMTELTKKVQNKTLEAEEKWYSTAGTMITGLWTAIILVPKSLVVGTSLIIKVSNEIGVPSPIPEILISVVVIVVVAAVLSIAFKRDVI